MTDSQIPSDAELLRLTHAGDENAFVILYRRYQGRIFRFALQMIGCASTAEDVTQEVFLVLMGDASNYDVARGSLSAYLHGIARNHVWRNLQRNRLLVPMAEDPDETYSFDPVIAPDNPLDDLTRREGIVALERAVRALPPHYREVVVLCNLEEMSYADAAEVLDCAVGTVRSRLHRAHALLVDKLRNSSEPQPTSRLGNVSRCFA